MAFLPISRLGDKGVHLTGPDAGVEGVIFTATAGSPTKADGIQVAVAGDIYKCDNAAHNTPSNVLIPVISDVIANGKVIITVNATTTCGATIIQGSSDVSAE
jgi:uncharacterized Zn-binding protein involved in type VI secretion